MRVEHTFFFLSLLFFTRYTYASFLASIHARPSIAIKDTIVLWSIVRPKAIIRIEPHTQLFWYERRDRHVGLQLMSRGYCIVVVAVQMRHAWLHRHYVWTSTSSTRIFRHWRDRKKNYRVCVSSNAACMLMCLCALSSKRNPPANNSIYSLHFLIRSNSICLDQVEFHTDNGWHMVVV